MRRTVSSTLLLSAVSIILLINLSYSAEVAPGFFRFPDINGEWIAFTSEGDLWKVKLSGGAAVRLTTATGEERFPKFSPDGQWIAFSGQTDGQDDIFVIPSSGGEPLRLTYHPDRDQVEGWDKKGNIIFRSMRESPHYFYKLFRIQKEGGFPVSIGLEKAAHITFEPNGSRVAFNTVALEFRTWKRYQGGWAEDIYVGDIAKVDFKKVTELGVLREWQGNYSMPMWHTDGRIYFQSDRSGRGNIWSMTPDASDIKQHTFHKDFDARFPALGGKTIVYQLGMDVWTLDLASGKTQKVDIALPTDRLQAQSKFVDPKQFIQDFELTPDGKRLLLCSRGELFTAPTKGEGLVRQLTYTSGIREKFPHVSPDGKFIAAFSDATGEEKLYLYPADGGEAKLLGTDSRGWHFGPIWSPDGKTIAFSNEECELILMDAITGKTLVADKSSWEIRDYSWSADSRFVAYSSPTDNYNSIVKIYDTSDKKAHDVTVDYTNSYNPKFTDDGKFLVFLSDKEANPRLDGMEMTYILQERTRPYIVALKEGTAFPFAASADPALDDDEEGKGDKHNEKSEKDLKGKAGKNKKDIVGDEEKKEPVKVEIDFASITSRIAPFPVQAANYGGLSTSGDKVFYLTFESHGMLGEGDYDDDEDGPKGMKLIRFDLKKKKTKMVADGIDGYDISRDGKRIVTVKDGQFTMMGIDEEGGGHGGPEGGPEHEKNDKNVDLSEWDLRVDQRPEWKQMFFEAWRLQRDFFWDPNLHQVDWIAVREQYGPLAARISTRDELNDLIGEMFGELNCSHTYVGGGDQRRPERRSTGLLGVDVSRDPSGFYKIERVIVGRPWQKDTSSPLAAPGIDGKKGEFIVAINGRATNSVADYQELLLNKADDIVSVKLNSKPSLDGAREVIIKPLGSERSLRYWDWADNRRGYVDEKSGGKLGYIHLTDMGGAGLSQFTQAYLPQHNKEGLVMDVRYNGGGFVAEMILSHLNRGMFAMGMARHGLRYRHPSTAFHGHMAAICNGETGSDGETFTEGFRRLGLGPIIGMRTWGGWVGIRSDKPLMDGGGLTQPEFTGWGVDDGKWMIEGWGTDPDFVVEDDPASLILGKDLSLDYTIKYLLEKIANEPKIIPPMPPFPTDRGVKH